ncbi:VOC family protein [Streptomyces sp. NPDC056452]|uniref:VOC family protein n=1 Tax=Streptomyces sp. NPDC056452 TaxID=3345821 RepID=UPI00369BD60D
MAARPHGPRNGPAVRRRSALHLPGRPGPTHENRLRLKGKAKLSPRRAVAPQPFRTDLQVDDLEVETERACALGATLEEHQPHEGVRVFRDPHGHPFCLFLPGA